VSQEEQLWLHHLRTTLIFPVQPEDLADVNSCAYALVRSLSSLPHGLDEREGNKASARGGDVLPEKECGLQQTCGTLWEAVAGNHAVDQQGEPLCTGQAAQQAERASSYDAYRGIMSLEGVGRCLHGHLLGAQSLLALAYSMRLQNSQTIVLACGRHAVCSIVVWDQMQGGEAGQAGAYLLAVSVPGDVVRSMLQHAATVVLVNAPSGDFAAGALVPQQPIKSADGGFGWLAARDMWEVEASKVLREFCAPWVLECSRQLPLTDTSSDEAEGQGMWQRHLL
jgi:hypothetical protein